MKNYNGKLKGLKGLDLVKEKKQEDEALASYIKENVELKSRYGSLMSDIDNLYKLIFNDAYRDMWLTQIYSSTSLLDIAKRINDFKTDVSSKPVADRSKYFSENVGSLKQSLLERYDSFDIDADKAIFTRMLEDAAKLPKNQRISVVDKQVVKGFNAEEQIDKFVSSRYQYTRLKDQNYVINVLLKSSKSLSDYNDPLLLFEREIFEQIENLRPEKERREGQLNKLMGDYVAVKERFKQQDFIPDANSTLRLTFGYVRGFSPADATYMKPFTTIKGMLEKGSTDNPEFNYPSKIKQLWLAKDFGPFAKKDLNDVPVSFLYNLDTTGGNSGSPVMNNRGELIGVDFDRAYEATINDYAWNENYSRSIGVDIRYVLWVASKVDNANFLLDEIGVKP